MMVFSQLVFDEYITTGTFFTSTDLSDKIGRYDQMAIMAVTDSIDANGQLTVRLQTSADGRNFTNKNINAEITGAGTGPGQGGISTGITNVNWGYDNGTVPGLEIARLTVSLTTTTKAHVKIYVTLRDQGA